MTPSIQRLKHKLHPRTGFMIFFPALCLIAATIPGFFSNSPNRWGGMEGIGAAALLDAVAVGFVAWLNFGHVVAWDDDQICVRQPDADWRLRRHPFASISFADIRGLAIHPPPRGVPPKYPLLEIQRLTERNGPPLLIDPNYFTASSLTTFIELLRERRPELQEGKEATTINGLLKRLAR